MKPKWNRKPCGCVKAELPSAGRVMIRCSRHRGKPSKRLLCYFDDEGIVRRDTAVTHLTHDPSGSFPSGTGVPEMATGALSRNQRGKSVTRIRAAHFHLTPDLKGSGR